MQATSRELADRIGATLEGSPDLVVKDARSLLQATADHLSFIEKTNRLFELKKSKARVLVAPADFPILADFLQRAGGAVLRVKDAQMAFLELVSYLRGTQPAETPGIDSRALIDPTVNFGADCCVKPYVQIAAGTRIGARCVLHANVVIGRNCILGDDVVLHPNVVLYEGTRLGNRITVHAGSVLGADGFGYRFAQGRHHKVPQLGWVEIGDDVEIGAGATIDRGMVDPTVIGAGTKIDNQVQIGHNCTIGEHNLLVAQVGVGGSSVTGKYVTLAGQVGVADHMTIGDGASVGAQAGVAQHIAAGKRVWGTPATEEPLIFQQIITMRRLPQMWRDLVAIKQLLGMNETPGKEAA